jgi:hypothetical protein
MASLDTKDVALDNAHSTEHVKGSGLTSAMDPERRKLVEKKLKLKLDLRCVSAVASTNLVR